MSQIFLERKSMYFEQECEENRFHPFSSSFLFRMPFCEYASIFLKKNLALSYPLLSSSFISLGSRLFLIRI